jgi:hypothetical protein
MKIASAPRGRTLPAHYDNNASGEIWPACILDRKTILALHRAARELQRAAQSAWHQSSRGHQIEFLHSTLFVSTCTPRVLGLFDQIMEYCANISSLKVVRETCLKAKMFFFARFYILAKLSLDMLQSFGCDVHAYMHIRRLLSGELSAN